MKHRIVAALIGALVGVVGWLSIWREPELDNSNVILGFHEGITASGAFPVGHILGPALVGALVGLFVNGVLKNQQEARAARRDN